MRTSDGHAMSTEQRSTCANPRCNCRRGGNPHAHELGIAHVGDYTIWLVGFVGTAWVPVALVQARTWFDARAKGEKIFAWVPRGRVEASSGQQAFSVRVERCRVSCAVCRKTATVVYHISELCKPTSSPDPDAGWRFVWAKLPPGWWHFIGTQGGITQVRCPHCACGTCGRR